MSEDNNICVYIHSNKSTGIVFYVGIGNIKRPYIKNNRNKYWHEYISLNDYEIEIVHYNLSWEEASKIEKKMIMQFGRKDKGLGNLLNKSNGGEGAQSVLKWNFKSLKNEALKYNTRGEFIKKSNGAYKSAIRNGILDKICSHMKYNRNSFKLTIENCLSIALMYSKKTHLMKGHKSIYNAIIKHGWQETCFAHMKKIYG